MPDGSDVPIFINSRDRLTPLRAMVAWFERAGAKRIVVIDNDSAYEPLLDWYRETPHEVVRLGRNVGKNALWQVPELLENVPGPFAYSDSDIVPVDECPLDALDVFLELLERYKGVNKAGFGIVWNDIPDHYPHKRQAVETERWQELWPLDRRCFYGLIDTNFAVYRPGAGPKPHTAARTRAPYVARHTSYYLDFENLSEEDAFYLRRAEEARSRREFSYWASSRLSEHVDPLRPPSTTTRLRWLLRGRRAVRRGPPVTSRLLRSESARAAQLNARVKASLKRRLPAPAVLVIQDVRRRTNRSRRAQARASAAEREREAAKLAPLGFEVHAGPFRGMRFLGRTAWGPLGPYLVGSYEEELHPHLERLLARGPERIVVLGAAEGYYAVGAAMRLPHAHVVAVDVDAAALRLCRELAALNRVSRTVETRRFVGRARLQRLLAADALVIVDCEGCERSLLDPVRVPGLRKVDLLVELHDLLDPGIRETIVERFAATHSVTIVGSKERTADTARYPALAALPEPLRAEALDEARWPAMQWAVLERRRA